MNRISPLLLDSLSQEILDWRNDFKAESLAAYLHLRGIDMEQIVFENQGSSKRSYRKEVSGFRTEIADYDNREYLFLQTNREGLYDALPENIFHQPTRGKTEKNTAETIQEIRRYKQEEAEARKFFLPFEYGFQHIKVLLHLFEQDFEKRAGNSRLVAIFSGEFPVLNKLDPFRAYVFLRLIPLIHQLRNDFTLVGHCLEMVVGVPFSFELVYGSPGNGHVVTGSVLGEAGLGIDLVTGGVVEDGEPFVKITIGPVGAEIQKGFISGGSCDILLDELLCYFIAADYEVVKDVVVEEEKRKWVLDGGTLLGISAFI